MGQEITSSQFTQQDFLLFRQRLQSETELLKSWFDSGAFSSHCPRAGYEMEAWLIDDKTYPSPKNTQFLHNANNPLYTAELAQFNIELNAEPADICGNFLSRFEQNLQAHWCDCQRIADDLECRILSTGILPSLRQADLDIRHISMLLRYQALNQQVLIQRGGRPLVLNINGVQSLKTQHHDVMLEAAATSLQIHLQSPLEMAHHYYNASLLVSAPLVAISANSPFLFSRDLWSETRIPVFEQAVDVGGYSGAAQGPIHRVSFGSDYARASLLECFEENLQHFPVLLPMCFSEDASKMQHLSLHNGTIWRWNRPLIGYDDDGTPHLRIEHRVIPSGPSMIDNIANMAFYFGLVHYYAAQRLAVSQLPAFAQVRDNFYTCAQHGLENKINWPGHERCDMRQLILHTLIDQAQDGLEQLGLDGADIRFYLGVIRSRAELRQTGTHWQREFVKRQGMDMQRLVETYYHNQQTAEPVHCWDFVSYV